MSDQYRKNFSDKVSETVKPDSEKGVYEQGKEFVTDQADKYAGKFQSQEDKGLAQNVHDSAQKGKDESTGKPFSESAQEYMEEAKSKINEAAEYISKQVHGGDSK